METFEEFLESKKIDSKAFRQGDHEHWSEFESLFNQMHPKSLTSQKLFLINRIRREYPLTVEQVKREVKKKIAKPVMKPKPKVEAEKENSTEKVTSKPKIKPKIVSKPKVVVKPKIKPPKKD